MTAPAMTGVARWSIAHRWLVIAGWVLLAVAGSLAAAADTSQAVIRGIGYTGHLVASGALIRCLAFIALGGVPVTDVKILSTGLAAGIIIDATLIRGILAPPSSPSWAASTGGCARRSPGSCTSHPSPRTTPSTGTTPPRAAPTRDEPSCSTPPSPAAEAVQRPARS